MADDVDEFLEDLVLRGQASREFTVAGVRWRLRVLNLEEYQDLYARAAGVPDLTQRTVSLQIELLAAALTHVNDVPCSRAKADDVLARLPVEVVDQLHERYMTMEDEYRALVRQPERLQAFVDNNHFARVRFKVMKAVGALPTEDRCLRMIDVQWMWFYMNMLKDAKEEADGTRDKLDYLAWFINPEAMQRVQERRRWEESAGKPGHHEAHREVHGDQEVIYHDTRVNSDFERELSEAMGDEKGMELPDEHFKGDPTESREDFISRVVGQQARVQAFNDGVIAKHSAEQASEQARQAVAEAKAAGVDPGQLDFIEVNVPDQPRR